MLPISIAPILPSYTEMLPATKTRATGSQHWLAYSRPSNSPKKSCKISPFLRLPLFLQQAGHFEAAKYEFIYLLEQMDNFVALEVAGRQNLRQQKSFVKNHNLELLFDKACLIFQRKKIWNGLNAAANFQNNTKKSPVAANEALKAARQKRIRAHREE